MADAPCQADPAVRVVGEVRAPVETPAPVLVALALKPSRPLQEIGVQGADLDVLHGAGDNLASLGAVEELSLVARCDGQALLSERWSFVTGDGFRCVDDTRSGGLLQVDGTLVGNDLLARDATD